MSYQVLARKWRPRSFREMAGQEHVLRALINALDNDRLHHAYLFTGTRGVGKTTIARILAKSLNCETGISSTPCGECSACREVDEGRFVDLVEVDAASRTGVDETRELLDNVQYAPTRGRYKVYLIDEVHMFSNSSFNALLKTLEEPPPHVKFLLATTDPQKLPATILSRCLQFSLKRLPVALIQTHMAQIVAAEGVEAAPAALALLASAADGSMRDGLSLLDQALAFGGGVLREEEVRAMLGTVSRDHVFALLEALHAGDGQRLLEVVATLGEHAGDPASVLEEMATLLHRITVVQVVDGAPVEIDDAERIRQLASMLSAEAVQLWYQVAIQSGRDLPLAPSPQIGLEMALLRMLAFRPLTVATPAAPVVAVVPPAAPAPPPASVSQPAASSEAPPPASTAPAAAGREPGWAELVEQLDLAGMGRQLAMNCTLVSRVQGRFELALAEEHRHLRTPRTEARLIEVLTAWCGEPVQVLFADSATDQVTPAEQQRQQAEERLDAAREVIDRDPMVRAMRETFDAQVVEGSIRPLENLQGKQGV